MITAKDVRECDEIIDQQEEDAYRIHERETAPLIISGDDREPAGPPPNTVNQQQQKDPGKYEQ